MCSFFYNATLFQFFTEIMDSTDIIKTTASLMENFCQQEIHHFRVLPKVLDRISVIAFLTFWIFFSLNCEINCKSWPLSGCSITFSSQHHATAWKLNLVTTAIIATTFSDDKRISFLRSLLKVSQSFGRRTYPKVWGWKYLTLRRLVGERFIRCSLSSLSYRQKKASKQHMTILKTPLHAKNTYASVNTNTFLVALRVQLYYKTSTRQFSVRTLICKPSHL